jgi:hypothetical protein
LIQNQTKNAEQLHIEEKGENNLDNPTPQAPTIGWELALD